MDSREKWLHFSYTPDRMFDRGKPHLFTEVPVPSVAYSDRFLGLPGQLPCHRLQGDTSLPEGLPSPHLWKTLSQEERQQRAMRLAQGPLARRGRPRNDLSSGFSHAWEQFHHLLVTLTAHDRSKPCYQGRGILPVHALAHAGIFELAIHSWDIRSALEPSARALARR